MAIYHTHSDVQQQPHKAVTPSKLNGLHFSNSSFHKTISSFVDLSCLSKQQKKKQIVTIINVLLKHGVEDSANITSDHAFLFYSSS